MVGEVWVCSGQSNMEWSVAQSRNGKDEAAAANHPVIRLFMVPNTVSVHPRIDTEGAWAQCTPQSVAGFSAVGYFFAREIQKTLNVPIGLISADWGGTLAEAWMSQKALAPFSEYTETLAFLDTIRKDPAARDTIVRKGREDWWAAIDKASKAPAEWAAPGFNDSSWKLIPVPGAWGVDGLGTFDGILFVRKSFELEPQRAGADALLELGPIDDFDDVYLNGQKVGATHDDGQWNTPRAYNVPIGTLKPGRNTIAVRVLDTAGPGGLNGKPEQLVLKATAGAWSLPLAGEWKYQRGAALSELPAIPQSVTVHQNTPTCLYSGMISPIKHYTIRGALWYQGESNRGRAAQYRTLFPALIKDWRETWGIGDFPFYFVQIAPFRYGNDTGQTAEVREAQMLTLKVPNTGMAVTMDIGNPTDIHPDNKQDVGKRLALWALAQTYGKTGFEYSGPLYKAMSVEGDKIRLRFDHPGAGLSAKDGSLKAFLVAGADKQFHKASATIEGDSVVVSSPKVSRPVAVRYSWGDADVGTLFNKDGLPASSFRTDDWPGPLPPVPTE